MQTSLFLLFGFLFAVSLGMVIIPRILVISHKKRLYDVPDARKVHTMPVPRLGGLSFFPVILMSMFLVIGFRLYFWDMDTSSLSFNMLYEYLFLFVGMTLLYLFATIWSVLATAISSPCRSPLRFCWYCQATGSTRLVACSVFTRCRFG